MTVSNELFLSILGMDSYNRGYNPGIALDANASSIGTATIAADSTSILGLDVTSGAGFYALSYTWRGQPVISYRGTDNVDFLAGGGGNDTLIYQKIGANLDEEGRLLRDDDGKIIARGTFDILSGGAGYDTCEINSNITHNLRDNGSGYYPDEIYQFVSAIVEDLDGRGIPPQSAAALALRPCRQNLAY